MKHASTTVTSQAITGDNDVLSPGLIDFLDDAVLTV
ncbi:hypothetical protein GON09_000996 [Rhodococcus sp. B50]|nr:hypothetical protein [Rhodococcus sp. B50]